MLHAYLAVIERGKSGDGFSAFFPDMLGCVSAGDTVGETVANAAEALSLHIEGLLADNDQINPPKWDGSFQTLDPDFHEIDIAAVCPVSIDT